MQITIKRHRPSKNDALLAKYDLIINGQPSGTHSYDDLLFAIGAYTGPAEARGAIFDAYLNGSETLNI